MNFARGSWTKRQQAPARRCVHVDERGRRCRTVFSPTVYEPANTKRCQEHRVKYRGTKRL